MTTEKIVKKSWLGNSIQNSEIGKYYRQDKRYNAFNTQKVAEFLQESRHYNRSFLIRPMLMVCYAHGGAEVCGFASGKFVCI